jgi:hypothetical protein
MAFKPAMAYPGSIRDPKRLTSLDLTRFHNGLGCTGLCLCAMQIAGPSFLFCFELFNSPLQSFNPGFHVLVDLRAISIIKFIHCVLPHGRLLDEDYQSVTQSRKWTNCLSTKVETVEVDRPAREFLLLLDELEGT